MSDRGYDVEFTDETKQKAWERSKGQCENPKCKKDLVQDNHTEGERGAWDAHHVKFVSKGGGNSLANCMVLCLDCHKKLHSGKLKI